MLCTNIAHSNVVVGRCSLFRPNIRFRPDAIEICCTSRFTVVAFDASLFFFFTTRKIYSRGRESRARKAWGKRIGKSRLDQSHTPRKNYGLCNCNSSKTTRLRLHVQWVAGIDSSEKWKLPQFMQRSCTYVIRKFCRRFSHFASRCYSENGISRLDTHYWIVISIRKRDRLSNLF